MIGEHPDNTRHAGMDTDTEAHNNVADVVQRRSIFSADKTSGSALPRPATAEVRGLITVPY